MKRLLMGVLGLMASGCGVSAGTLSTTSVPGAAPTVMVATVRNDAVTTVQPAAPPASAELRAFEDAKADPRAFSVCTYNTGVGDKSHAKQSLYADLPMFQRAVNGAADAPIICTQETGPDLGDRLRVLQNQTHNFDVFWMTTTPFHQGNLLVVPKRFKVIAHDEDYYSGRLAQAISNLFDGKKDNWGQTQEHRGFMWVQLVDTQTGKFFTVYDTHISYWSEMRARQGKQLAAAIATASAKGPVIACGDFNTPTPDTNRSGSQAVVQFWSTLAPLGLVDMGPSGTAGISDWGSREDIDHVLAKGFTSLHQHMYTGSEVSLAGYADAQALSDHYPEEDVLAFQ